jgi:hypothetical protein
MEAKYLFLCFCSLFFCLTANGLENASREVQWTYIGRSFGGDDVFIDGNHVSRNSEADAIRAAMLVNRQNCSEKDMGLPSDTSDKHRKQCIDSFKYASSIEGVAFWCGNEPHHNNMETLFGMRFDDFYGKGRLVAKSDDPIVTLIEADRPSRRARDWLCKNIH